MRPVINELTMNELIEKLQQLDELTILELLDVTSEELVEFLSEQIVEKYDQLIEYFGDDEEE
jgi:hypothetical protein